MNPVDIHLPPDLEAQLEVDDINLEFEIEQFKTTSSDHIFNRTASRYQRGNCQKCGGKQCVTINGCQLCRPLSTNY